MSQTIVEMRGISKEFPWPGARCGWIEVYNRDRDADFDRFARSLLEQIGLLDRFVTVIGGDTMGPGRSKPAADPIREMIARCGGGTAAFVGDTTIDVAAAHAAGIPCVGVAFGLNDKPAHELGADHVISHFDELLPALRAMAPRPVASGECPV